ncbi:MAG: 50S ribosomal protein L3 [Candidatus Rokubacteria bacterium]|nr:50S ribosomal protein L3 [Candidatus Rokubacteria bacterium]MBI2879736.1 50S ribosomal protein L3 [Candidatus Rokubacteria bacterium]
MAKARKEPGLIGRKRGMAQLFGADGDAVPATVIQAGPCTVVQVKTLATDGYEAVQLGFEERAKGATKPLAGHFKRAGLAPMRVLRELRLESSEGYQVGQRLAVDLFSPGELVDVTGISKGRGFQGGIKRHGWKGGKASHGSMFHRAPGSIGASSDPSRVFPGHRLPGRMGGDRVTVSHLEVVRVLPEQNLLVVKGAVPGAPGGLVLVRRSVKLSKAQQKAQRAAKKG